MISKDAQAVTGAAEVPAGVVPEQRRPLRELLDDSLLDELLARSRDDAGGLRLTGEGPMLGEMVRAVLERALEAGLTAHLGYGKHDRDGQAGGNARNGSIGKTVQAGAGPVPLRVHRDRAGTFEPLLVPRRAGRASGGLDDMVTSLCAHGMPDRDIIRHLRQAYGTELPAETVSRITGAVLEEVRAWQARPPDPACAVVLLDAIVARARDNQVVQSKPAYVATGVDADGEKHVLGTWLPRTPPETATPGEAARFRAPVMAGLRNRGVRDILIACAGGLNGFAGAITATFPSAAVQRCVVHLIRNSLRPVARRDAAAVAGEPRKACTAPAAGAAPGALAAFEAGPWGQKYPQAVKPWEQARDDFTPFPAFSPGVRRLLCTTSSIESLNYQLRKATKARGHFPTDDAVVKLPWLAIISMEDKRARERADRREQAGKRSDQPARLVEGQRVTGWREALNELDLAYPGRLR